MSLDLGELNVILDTDKSKLKLGLKEAEREVRSSGRQMEAEARATAASMSEALASGAVNGIDGFFRDANGRLHDHQGRFVAEAAALGAAAGGAANGGLRQATGMFDQLHTSAGKALGAISPLIPALLITAAAAIFLVPAMASVLGLLAAIPALAAGGAVGVAALVIGLAGLTDAFKNNARAGATMADHAHQVELAERRLRDANREATAAQDDLTRARERAVERMEDLNRSLASARLDERSAALAVAEARQALARASVSGDRLQIDRARLSYEQAQQAVEDVRDRVEDLNLEQQRNAAAGVEGSDEVLAALQRQERAIEGVSDAQYELARSHQAVGAAVAEVTALAPEAQRLVDTIKAMGPGFTSWRLDLQQRMFSGVADDVKLLATAWFPTLDARTDSLAGTFNKLFRTWASSASKPEFVADMDVGMASVEKLIDRVGSSIAGPLVDAWGRLARAASPILDALGDEIGGMVDDFSAWIRSADESGKLESFMDKSAEFLREVFGVGKDVVSIFGSLMSIWMDNDDLTTVGWDAFRKALHGVSDWLKDPENRKKIDEWYQKIREFVGWVKDDAVPTVKGWVDKIQEWSDRIGGWIDRAKAFRDGVRDAVNDVADAVTGLPSRISGAASHLFDGIPSGFRAAMNWVIGKWNNLSFTLPSISVFGQQIGGGGLETPNIDFLADGGLVRRTPGGRLAVLAEGGQDEIVAPEDKMRAWIAQAVATARGIAGGTITLVLETRGVVRTTRRQIRYDGGDVQFSMGADY